MTLCSAVSYTHLDVYKRQDHGLPSSFDGSHTSDQSTLEGRAARLVTRLAEHEAHAQSLEKVKLPRFFGSFSSHRSK